MLRQDKDLTRMANGYLGQQIEYSIPMSIYPAQSGVIIINAPGAGESKSGRKNRYETLGQYIQEKQIAAFITHNPPKPDAEGKFAGEPYSYQDTSWNLLVIESLANVIEYALEHAEEICGTSTPVLYLSGFSAGASACGAVAFHYPQVKSILLLSAYDSVGEYFYSGIRQFTGDIYAVYGSDDLIAKMVASMLEFSATSANFHLTEIPDCDHGFHGSKNSRIFSKAFFWAFDQEKTFPSPDNGLLLYEED